MVNSDRSFIQGIASNTGSQVFLRHLLGPATGFGFSTIAEGVEIEEEAEILRREGVCYLQGHHLWHPDTRPARAKFGCGQKVIG